MLFPATRFVSVPKITMLTVEVESREWEVPFFSRFSLARVWFSSKWGLNARIWLKKKSSFFLFIILYSFLVIKNDKAEIGYGNKIYECCFALVSVHGISRNSKLYDRKQPLQKYKPLKRNDHKRKVEFREKDWREKRKCLVNVNLRTKENCFSPNKTWLNLVLDFPVLIVYVWWIYRERNSI